MPSDSLSSSEAKDIPGSSRTSENCDNDPIRARTESESSDKSGPRFVLPGTPNSPPKILTLDEVQDVVKNIKNMALAHEIAVNNDFKLEAYEPPENSIEKVVKETIHKAFWNILRTQLESDPPVYDHALVLLNDIKEAFQSILLENNKKVMDKINEMLDADLIKQQAEQGVLDFKAYSNFIVHVMSLACAPIRDEAVAKLREIDDIVDSFRGILETLALMKLDMANCLLNAARHEVIANSVSYEKQKFKEYLEYYKEGFPATEAWLKRNIQAVEQPNSSASSSSIPISPDRKAKDIIFNAYMELLCWKSENEFPEFFSMDHDRIVALQGRALRVCACASSFAIVSGLPVIAQSADVRKNLAMEIEILLQNINTDKELEDALTSVWLQVKKVLEKRIEELHQKPIDEETEASLKSHILKVATIETSPVRALMWKRLTTYIQLILRSNIGIPPPPGFVDFAEELEALGNAFKRVTFYNYAVYGEYYHDILSKIGSN
ncbi:CLUMA_CG004944, isoform A [Clunio marinus]|uniref:CLUMA_CG004944, isoform A n=1 Tax=Clunio marinus TaxID=568069 RepID=A0A1J1HT74_9DIPT|nr:CLUMA_CG004944, isoform A [Clunio marinus]